MTEKIVGELENPQSKEELDLLQPDEEKLLEFKRKYLTSQELDYIRSNPLSKSQEAKLRAFVNLTLDVSIAKMVKQN